MNQLRVSPVCLLTIFSLAALLPLAPARAAEASLPGAPPPAASPPGASRVITASTFRDIAADVSPAVVNIQAERVVHFRSQGERPSPFRDFFGDEFFFPFMEPPRDQLVASLGSGVIISNDGYILTNNHVVEGVDQITVILLNGDEYPAKVVGSDERTDLALLKTEELRDFKVARLGDSDALRPGDWVMAIGNPFGYSHTVTVGVVSALSRSLGQYQHDLIQSDAPINPGNSGGPMIDLDGNVVGINTAIASRTGESAGLGFAIPINRARDVMQQLRTTGRVTRGYLGVMIQRMSRDLARSLGLEEVTGALVSEVTPASPAARAGIERGDVVLRYDGRAIEEFTDLSDMVAATRVGSEVSIELLRDGKQRTVRATIEELEEQTARAPARTDGQTHLGMRLRPLSRQEARQFGRESGGLVIEAVEAGSPADRAGIERGDIVSEVNRTRIETVEEFERIVGRIPAGGSALLYIHRDQSSLFFAVPVGESE